MTDALVGELWDGRYLVQRLLGVGGMGEVYLALQAELDRPVALKLLRPEIATDELRRRRFQREAMAASRINHPHLATIYEFGQWRGQLYLAMEYLDGVSLDSELASEGTLSSERSGRVAAQICDALIPVHKQQILHRDIKPGNVMLLRGEVPGAAQEQVKLVDFGLALLRGAHNPRLTRKGLVTGTPGYMSPEQCRGKELAERSDLYGVGVVLYQMLCGRPPFEAKNHTELIIKQIFEDPLPPSEHNPGADIHPTLEALALWLLNRDRAARPRDATQVKQELESALALLAGDGGAVTTGSPGPVATEMAPRPDELARRASLKILSVEPERPFTESLTALMRFHGYQVHRTDELGTLCADQPEVDAVVLDLRDDADALLDQVEDLLQQGRPRCPLLAVGPDDAVELMARAIQLGFYIVVPASEVGPRLPSALRRMWRKKMRDTSP